LKPSFQKNDQSVPLSFPPPIQSTIMFKILSVIAVCATIFVQPTAATVLYEVYEGYLTDYACLQTNALAGLWVYKDVPNHTKSCLLMQTCVDSGFGLMEWNATGSFYFPKYKFNMNGNTLSEACIQKSTMTKGFKVNITGTVQGDAYYMGDQYIASSILDQVPGLTGVNLTYGTMFNVTSLTSSNCPGKTSGAATHFVYLLPVIATIMTLLL